RLHKSLCISNPQRVHTWNPYSIAEPFSYRCTLEFIDQARIGKAPLQHERPRDPRTGEQRLCWRGVWGKFRGHEQKSICLDELSKGNRRRQRSTLVPLLQQVCM